MKEILRKVRKYSQQKFVHKIYKNERNLHHINKDERDKLFTGNFTGKFKFSFHNFARS